MFFLQDTRDKLAFERIKGYPKRHCRAERINYIRETLIGDRLLIIPRLLQPDTPSTRIEVSGQFLESIRHDFQDTTMFNKAKTLFCSTMVSDHRDEEAGGEKIMAKAFEGVYLTNASLSFDIRVTAEDNVTSNLYRFVFGPSGTPYELVAAGSSFDKQQNPEEDKRANQSSSGEQTSHQRTSKNHWCEECPPGTFSIGVDALQCALCRPGRYASQSGSFRCNECPEGTFTYTWGSEACRYRLEDSVSARSVLASVCMRFVFSQHHMALCWYS